MSDDFEAGAGASGAPKPSLSTQLPIVRNRHGRTLRRVTLSPLFTAGSGRIDGFEEVVKNTVDFIKANYAEELGDLKYQIFDAPSFRADAKRVRRWAVKTNEKTIVIYRLPIERFGGHRRKNPFEIRMSIEFQVFSAAANLIGREPDFFLR